MAITEVASRRAATGNNDGVDSAALAFPNNVTSGNLLVVLGAAWGSSAPTSIGVTDSRSTSYTVILGAIPSGLTWRTFIAFGAAASSGAGTVTVNPSGSSAALSFSIDEFTGQHGTPTDVDGGNSVGNLTNGAPFTASDSITTEAADALIVGVMSHDAAGTALTAATNYTTIGENEANSSNQCHHAVFRLVTTAQAYTVGVNAANANNSASPGWSMQTYSFKPSAGGVFIATAPRIIQQAVHRSNTY